MKDSPEEDISRERETVSVTFRIQRDHLEALERVAKNLGIKRSGAIQIAIAELIERKKKN